MRYLGFSGVIPQVDVLGTIELVTCCVGCVLFAAVVFLLYLVWETTT